ncbi:SDR family oxidoreductase [Falsochrobactrum sp. TDYN1]|uniref:SDR family oxidoreductase n=1 Tax=Falsochrobactrum tianjinense TaxID=2706015 RepID=A0A949PMY7_9HYPH|nr:SDR family oxidoreductase [Falsochrobactrum sp. TDYN1]MBV2143404.1 SDR family oxidoreductase [Falsochrobactrum sp. TDYN1]
MTSKTAIIIGGTSGIGKAIALRFAAEGNVVIVSGRNAERGQAVADEINSKDGRGIFVTCDISDPDSVMNLLEASRLHAGEPTILVNSGGILQSGTRVLDQDLHENRRLWETNYNGTLIACQVFGKAMKAAERGVILNIGSLASFAPLSLPAYTAGKTAILALTQMLAAELGPFGVRVNGVAPGYTLSDGLRQKIADGLRDPDEIKATTALRAFVEPEHVADAAWFLCSEKAASITGVMLPVDAGWLVQAPYASYMRGNPIRDSTSSRL